MIAVRTSGRVVTEDMEMIRQTKTALAREQVREFIDRMKRLGFNKEEVVELLEQEGEHE